MLQVLGCDPVGREVAVNGGGIVANPPGEAAAGSQGQAEGWEELAGAAALEQQAAGHAASGC